MLIFDIGANTGKYAIANNTGNTIISVEASPITYEKLLTNVSSYTNITALNYAVCNSSESTTTFYHCSVADTLSTLDKDWITSSVSRFADYGNNMKEFEIPVISLDKLIDIYGTPDLLKIDVEGAENIVLKSLTKKVPLLCFEWAAEWRNKNLECIEYLYSMGYTKFAIQLEDKYTYRPESFNLTYEDVKNYLINSKDKVDWGMVWVCM